MLLIWSVVLPLNPRIIEILHITIYFSNITYQWLTKNCNLKKFINPKEKRQRSHSEKFRCSKLYPFRGQWSYDSLEINFTSIRNVCEQFNHGRVKETRSVTKVIGTRRLKQATFWSMRALPRRWTLFAHSVYKSLESGNIFHARDTYALMEARDYCEGL